MRLIKLLLTTIAAGGLTSAAVADLSYSFTTDVEGVQNAQWVAGPAGWATGPVITSVNTAGGWTLGSGGGPMKEFSWTPGGGVAVQQVEMRNLASGGNARLSFDIMVDGSSFNQNGQWYNLWYAGNSDGAGWTQVMVVDSWQNALQADLRTWHIDVPFSTVGWTPAATWFQLGWGANSDAANPVHFYVDNFRLYVVPEPGLLALVGLGAAALLTYRRR